MLLALGPHQFDITHRAIVLGVVDPVPGLPPDEVVRDAGRLVEEGAAALTIGRAGPVGEATSSTGQLVAAVTALVDRFDQPVVVRTPRASVAEACLAAGAVAAHDDSGADPAYPSVVASAGATIVVGSAGPPDDVERLLADRARDAGAAGLDARRVVVDAGGGADSPPDVVQLLRNLDRVARLGWPVLLSTAGDHVSSIATCATGVLRGARILQTRDVRAARRVAEVAARLLREREAFERLREAS